MKFGELLARALDIVLPRRTRNIRTSLRTLEEIPLRVETHELLGVRITTLMDYRMSEVADLIRSLKYDGAGHAGRLAASVLEEYLREEIAEARAFSARPIAIAPVPLHRARLRERGFNQIELVLKNLSREFRDGALARVEGDALTRVRPTKQQTHLSRDERLRNVSGAFELSKNHGLSGAHVFLLDDVVTTGATLVHASRPLISACIEVTLVALARA
jgi:ComF family protein